MLAVQEVLLLLLEVQIQYSVQLHLPAVAQVRETIQIILLLQAVQVAAARKINLVQVVQVLEILHQ